MNGKRLSEKQRRLLGEMLHRVLLEIRGLTFQGKTEQAHALADAFHNLPIEMHADDFDWVSFRRCFLEPYHKKYPPLVNGGYGDYLALLDEIQNADDKDAFPLRT